MKKLFYFCMACLLAILASCVDSKDADLVSSEGFHFREPALLWGCNQQQITEAMKEYQLIDSSRTSLSYLGKESELAYLYAFSTAYSTLSYVVVSFHLDDRSKVYEYFRTHYKEINGDQSNLMFTDSSKSMYITVVMNDLLYVTYMDAGYMAR